MEKFPVVRAEHITVSINNRIILNDVSFIINEGEQWAITGASGTGKSTLLQVLSGKQFFRGRLVKSVSDHAAAHVVLVEQQHHFKNLSNTTNFYYQQRFNSSDADDSITVNEDLLNHIDNNNADDAALKKLVHFFHLEKLLEERLIQLSNGENKRLQIAKALLDKPDILLLDNPFIGLDTHARDLLDRLLMQISRQGVHIIMVTGRKEIPAFITHVLELKEAGMYSIDSADWYKKNTGKEEQELNLFNEALFSELISKEQDIAFKSAVKMSAVNISYHGRKILDDINWEVKKGERWSLYGPNGAGKSTLLSLINADNPQAYANNIFLFDRKRGTGETIWEIKKKIGYISPELHLHFEQSNNSFEVVASGLFDTIGLFRQLNDDQIELVNKWMQLLHIEKLRSKMLFQLSNSEQRMVLLARALVKNPPMLVLDEPCQGLDDHQVKEFKELINQICIKGNKTLIYVSHYPEEIPQCVDRFLRLEEGRGRVI
jgi:molybdate transport system ATP-binding protein